MSALIHLPCDTCHSTGEIEIERHGGRFDPHLDTWVQDTTITKCLDCTGKGFIEVQPLREAA